jgi:hypothetical protein
MLPGGNRAVPDSYNTKSKVEFRPNTQNCSAVIGQPYSEIHKTNENFTRNKGGMMKRLSLLIAFMFTISFCQPNVWAQKNDILDFRVISDKPNELIVEVDYVYSGNMGKKIGLSAGVSGEQDYKIGVSPAWVHTGRNVAKIYLSAIEERASGPFTTRDLRFYMYEQLSGQRVSMIKRFPFKKTWLVDRPITRKGHRSKQNQRHQISNRLAYQVHGYSKEAGGSFKAMIQFVSKYQAKLQMDHSFQTDEWIDMRVETVSKRNIRMLTMLPSGNSMKWDIVFSRDMKSLNGNVIMSSSNKSHFEVTGRRVE